MQEKISLIETENVPMLSLDYIVKEYLVHSGYQETFNSMEIDGIVNDQIDERKTNQIELEYREMSDLSWKNDFKVCEMDELPYDLDKVRKYSADDGMPKEPAARKRTLSLILDRINDETERQGDIFLIINFLKERKIILNMLNDKEYDTAHAYFETNFKSYLSTKEFIYKRIILCLVILKYLESIKKNDYLSAYNHLNKLDQTYWCSDVTISLFDNTNKIREYTLEALSVLVCYSNIWESELSYLLQEKQNSLIADQINSRILELAGISSESVLEKVTKQQELVNAVYRTIKNCPGEKLTVKLN